MLKDNVVVHYAMDDLPGADRVDGTGRGNTLVSFFPRAPNNDQINLGRSSDGTHGFSGGLAMWGKWNRLLSAAEKTSLYNSGSGRQWSAISAGSLNDAVLYYNLDGASWADATGRNTDLTPTGSPGSMSGPGGNNAFSFDGSTQYATHADATDFRCLQGQSWTIAIWAYLTSSASGGTSVEYLIGKNTQDNVEWLVYYPHAVGRSRWQFDLGYAITDPTLVNVKADNAGQPNSATWYFLIAEYDYDTNTLTFSVNLTEDSYTPVATPDLATVPYTNKRVSYFPDADTFDISTVPTGQVGPKYVYKTSTANDDLAGGNNSYSVAFNFKLDSLTHDMMLLGKWDANIPNSPDWAIWWRQSDTSLVAWIGNGNASNKTESAVLLNDTNQHCVVMTVTPGGSLSLLLDNGNSISEVLTAIAGYTPASFSVQFRIGALLNANESVLYCQLHGKIWNINKWSRVITVQEKTEFYNNGVTFYYPFITSIPKVKIGGTNRGPLKANNAVVRF